MSDLDQWKYMDECENKGHIVCGSSQSPDQKEEVGNRGIVTMHAYTISEIIELKTSTEGIVKLIKMRNPWGHTEWDGEWSDSSSKWTPKLRKKLNHYEKDDGEFFIKYEDYLTYYGNTSITHYEPHYEYQCIPVKQARSSHTFVEIDVDMESHFYFYVQQKNPRLKAQALKELQPSPSHIIIAKVTDEDNDGEREFEYIDGAYSTDRVLLWNSKNFISTGKYVIFIEVDWSKESKVHEYSLCLYSDNDLKMELGSTSGVNHGFLESVMKS